MKSEASHHTDAHNGVTACFHLQSDRLVLQQPLQNK